MFQDGRKLSRLHARIAETTASSISSLIFGPIPSESCLPDPSFSSQIEKNGAAAPRFSSFCALPPDPPESTLPPVVARAPASRRRPHQPVNRAQRPPSFSPPLPTNLSLFPNYRTPWPPGAGGRGRDGPELGGMEAIGGTSEADVGEPSSGGRVH
ncbi:hypothetical protein VPH35_111433 [Triticum aestivum]